MVAVSSVLKLTRNKASDSLLVHEVHSDIGGLPTSSCPNVLRPFALRPLFLTHHAAVRVAHRLCPFVPHADPIAWLIRSAVICFRDEMARSAIGMKPVRSFKLVGSIDTVYGRLPGSDSFLFVRPSVCLSVRLVVLLWNISRFLA